MNDTETWPKFHAKGAKKQRTQRNELLGINLYFLNISAGVFLKLHY
ncbi:MAG: hypothetical protein JWM28_841 [Chitinophagaceae bacterium]|nr:hypothetical protein [Chitinophagaceae bacterium]